MCGRQGRRILCRHRKTLPPGRYGTRRSWLTTLRGFVGAWQAQVKPTPLPYAKLLLVIGEKSSTLALHEIEDVNAKKEGQKQVRWDPSVQNASSIMSWSVGAFQIPLGILTDAAGLRDALVWEPGHFKILPSPSSCSRMALHSLHASARTFFTASAN